MKIDPDYEFPEKLSRRIDRYLKLIFTIDMYPDNHIFIYYDRRRNQYLVISYSDGYIIKRYVFSEKMISDLIDELMNYKTEILEKILLSKVRFYEDIQ
jgi:hypothetical protein